MNRKIRKSVAFFAALSLYGAGYAASDIYTLSGELSGQLGPGAYTVVDQISVPEGKKLIINAGAIVRFPNYSGFSVEGDIQCKGNAESPIIFTSAKDGYSEAGPEAFDWNGIKIDMSCGNATFENVIIKYSTFGMNIESGATRIQLRKVTFRNNGYANLTRSGKIVLAADGMPVNYFWPETLDGEDATGDDVSAGRTTGPPARAGGKKASAHTAAAWKWPTGIGCGVIALGGCALWIVSAVNHDRYDNLYFSTKDPVLAEKYGKKRENAATLETIGIIGTLLGDVGIAVTFLF